MTKTLLQSDMGNYLLSAISCLCLLHTGVRAKECFQAVLGRSETFHVPAGGSLSLSCVVEHCGASWKGHWMWTNSTIARSQHVNESVRHRLNNVTLSPNKTKQILELLSITQSDAGSYACSVVWAETGETEQGHLMHVNITAALPSQRSVLHRVLVCACASLCLPIILVLARFLSSEVKPQPLPRTLSTHAAAYGDQPHPAPQPPPRRPIPQKPPPKTQQNKEVVYAEVSQGAQRQQEPTREPAQSTVYSSLRFS
ncbi:uncharacterized protein LOC127361818 isoform X2 [Dicentrarchus labrax]|uniref:uncharacterized protein LOC127361818 isoform X2 n=1 Tax=Dicentrarchus labrax TaxID=13489 RepID=UPI0021F5D2F2|nr:uncharacterized protein LOC127361818 isoform X2 [Dicentrarchus labrax]